MINERYMARVGSSSDCACRYAVCAVTVACSIDILSVLVSFAPRVKVSWTVTTFPSLVAEKSVEGVSFVS